MGMTDYFFGRWLSNPAPGDEVVITGMSGRLPECNNIHEFRDRLFNKEDMVMSDDRRWSLNHPEVPQKIAKIYDIDKIDCGFFGLHYRQANTMDVMMRKFLEVAVEAVLDAGVNPSELEGSKTGVFVGACFSEMEIELLMKITEPQMMGLTGYLRSFVANRLSYFLKLKGPSYTFDTACSSSMNALEHAFKAIRCGQCDSAIVGGVNILLHPGVTSEFFRLGVLSSDGRCKVFDQEADGYVRGEAVACIFLQKSKDAKKIYAQVLHTKLNCDGFKPLGITYPSNQMQDKLMTEVLEESGFGPSDVSFLEMHGTGTEVGDLQEEAAVDCALGKKRQKPLLVGSVKSSIGHTEPASGLCSIIKVIIAMETGLIAPNINLNKIKEGMEGFEQGRLNAVTELTELEGEEAIVGINNFGFGGNNSHLLLRRFNKKKVNGGLPDDDIPRLICVSGRTEESLQEILDNLNHNPIDCEFVSLLHDLFSKNILNHLYRGYTIISNDGPLKSSVKFFGEQQPPLYIYFGQFDRSFKILGKYLLNFPVFKATMESINKYLLPKNINIIDTILKDGEMSNNLLGMIAVQIGIVDIFKLLELNPTAVYSLGKLVSAYYYEALTLEEAILIAAESPNFEEIFTNLKPSTAKRHNRYFNKHYNSLIKIETFPENLEGSLSIVPKNLTILNISDTSLNYKDFLLVENNTVTFLNALGGLYEQGHSLQLHRLYPKIQYPVSRGTPMISPLIKWKSDKSWYTYKYNSFYTLGESEQKEFQLTNLREECKFLTGHVIDGRTLIPATQYLNMVWETFSHCRRLPPKETPILFKNVRFIRAVMLPKTFYVSLWVNIQKGSGKFEVLENGSVVVTGWISSPKDVGLYRTDLAPLALEEDPTLVLEQDEIYRELYIRGYNYRGLFKGLAKCNVEATSGLVRWENNWITFVDKMFHLSIIQMDTRLLYVPTGIKKLLIEPSKLLTLVGNEEECLVPIHLYKDLNTMKCEGVEVCGLQARAISRKKSSLEPVLEKYIFVPNNSQLDLIESIRVNTQIILENSLESKIKAVEIFDDFTDTDSKFLLPLIKEVLEDIPLVSPDFIISTKRTLKEEILGIKTEDFNLAPNNKLLLVIGTKLLQRPILTSILNAVSGNSFVLTREGIEFSPEGIDAIEIITQHVTEKEKLILFRKSEQLSKNIKFIEVLSNHFDWMPEMKKSLKEELNVVVYCQNQELEGIIGLVNCIRREPGGSKVRCFFLNEAPDFDPRNSFYEPQIKKNLAVNVYKNCEWGTYRHLLLEDVGEAESEHCYVNVTSVGDLSSLKWIQGPLKPHFLPIQDGSTLIYSYYCSLNFKDIMIASGRISADLISPDRLEQDKLIGFEFSGRDSSGRRVIGMVHKTALATLIVGFNDFLWTVPENWSLEDAATVPVVYCTVLFLLLSLVTLKRGTTILIHSVTGGVGLAALNVCLYHGCEIFVTVGTQEKRDYLKKHYPQIPGDRIGNSRNTSFLEMVKLQTDGRGVDIVLNSLTGDKLEASIRCLARGGRLLEIGKYDLINDNSLNLLLMEKEISYHAAMLDQIFLQSSEKRKWLQDKIYEGMMLGYVKPLPRTVFKRDEVESAFRFMTTGKHMGKVLINIREEEEQKITEPSKTLFRGVSRFHCDPDKTYIIIGGLGGFGMELADWLILRGATKLVLVSSSGIRTGYQSQRIRIWKSHNVTIHISRNDVTIKQGCIDLIEEATRFGPVDGIFNLAVVLKDGLFEDQTEENFRISLAPKAEATMHLDRVTREFCPNLKYFVIFSSVSCGRGNVGQSNYGMANSIMERICEKRKREGFPALAIQWGAIAEVGLVAKMQKENKELVIGGTLQQRVSSCLEVLDKFLNQKHPIVASMVVAEKLNKNPDSIVEAIAYILNIKDLKNVNRDATLAELGMDSMMGTEVIQILEKDFDIYMTAKDIRSLTFAKLMELEEEKKKGNSAKQDKIELGTDFLIKCLPNSENCNLSIIKLPSSVCDEEEAVTVFVFPGIEGVLVSLDLFTRNLKAHVFGVQYSYHNPEDTLEQTAKSILPHMEETVAKEQTFHLICYSFGVIVALEVASLLEIKGYKGKVVAIEGSLTYLRSSSFYQLQSGSDAELQTDFLLHFLTFFLPKDVLMENKDKFLSCNSYEERLDVAASLIPSHVVEKKLDRQGAIVLYKRFQSMLNYSFAHDKIQSSVALLRAKFPMVTDMEDDYGLAEFCEHPVHVTVVEGDHASILNQSELIQAVNEILNSASQP